MFKTMKFAVSLGSLMLFAASCGILGPGDDAPPPYVIEVEAVTFSTPVSSQDTLRIRFHGWAGTNSCEGFYRMSVTPFQDGAIFKLWGHVWTGGGEATCNDVMIALVEFYDVPNPDPGYFHIVVIQPDGSELNSWAEISE
ncbi:MAG: hypothetical protein Q7W56_13505 [Candidatus Latescibacteria bacterium]|nr:hypothetical protein [Candidatus Latescibacterota bacterium]